MTTIELDMSDLKTFFQRLDEAAKGDLRQEMGTFFEGLGLEFLNKAQNLFMQRNKNTGYGQLVSSFTRGGDGNIWRSVDDGLTLEIGSSLSYVGYVNDGHYTLDPSKTRHFTLGNGEKARFVPGNWEGNRFIYDPSADGGMVLKYHWVEGLRFWEDALSAIEHLYPAVLEAKLRQWLNHYFG